MSRGTLVPVVGDSSILTAGLATVTESGVHFETCVPVRFRFVRNTVPAPKSSSATPTAYSQDVEPAGTYMLHVPGESKPPTGWEQGVAEFRCPLVLAFNTDAGQMYGPNDWKRRLQRAVKRKGLGLSHRLLEAGYDGIVTVRDGETSEIVDLRLARGWTKRRR